jgi:hypothetical protein
MLPQFSSLTPTLKMEVEYYATNRMSQLAACLFLVDCWAYMTVLMMEAIRSSETSVYLYQKILLFASVLIFKWTLDMLSKCSEIVNDKAEIIWMNGLLIVRLYEWWMWLMNEPIIYWKNGRMNEIKSTDVNRPVSGVITPYHMFSKWTRNKFPAWNTIL